MDDPAWTHVTQSRPDDGSGRRLRPLRRLLTGIGAPILVLAVLALLYFYDPTVGRPVFPCFFHALTGLDCAGCGLTRSLHVLLHGDVLRALDYNLIMPFWLLLPAYALLGEWLRALAGRRVLPVLRDRRWLLIALLVSTLAFMVLRNLPWEPFSWLAA